MARVALNQPGEDVTVGAPNIQSIIQLIGTTAGDEVITVTGGNVQLDASFNRGGDTIRLPGLASEYTAHRSFSEVIFTRAGGSVRLRIPIGTAGTEIAFDGGDSRTLLINTTTGQANLEGQELSTSSSSQTALTPLNPSRSPGYDVVNGTVSVFEGDAGSTLLVYTITLDRPVAAADGPLTINYKTRDGTTGTATVVGSDYAAAAGSLILAVGQQSASVTVNVIGDTFPEPTETIDLVLTGSALRNSPEVLVGSIINDDGQIVLTNGLDILSGGPSNESFAATGSALGAGDTITDSSTTDSDTLLLRLGSTDDYRTIEYSGFTLTNVENVVVSNNPAPGKSGVLVDLSGATGLKAVAAVISNGGVFFGQVPSLVDFIVENVSGEYATAQIFYQQAVTAGQTSVNLIVRGSVTDYISVGTDGVGNRGIETVNVVASGTTTIGRLISEITTLTISGGGDLTIVNTVNSNVRTIDASNAGRVTLDFSATFGSGVTFTGSPGSDILRSRSLVDVITTGAGNDTVNDPGGDDIIDTGTGNDTVNLLGSGNVTVDTGADDDLVFFAAGQFNANDKIAFGSGTDTLALAQSTLEADFARVTDVEVLTVGADATINLGNDGSGSVAQTAGIRAVNLNVGGTLIANDYTTGLTVKVFGSASVTTGSGDDVINLSNGLPSSVSTGAGNDTVIGSVGNDNLTGGLGKDLLHGGVGADTFRYLKVEDSMMMPGSVDNRDFIEVFVAGADKIDLTQLDVRQGQTIRFNGDFTTLADAQAAVASTGNDNFLDVVFARNAGIHDVLFVDSDNNGLLNDNDLQIIVYGVLGTLTASDITGSAPVSFNSVLTSYDSVVAVSEQAAMLRMQTSFEALQIG